MASSGFCISVVARLNRRGVETNSGNYDGQREETDSERTSADRRRAHDDVRGGAVGRHAKRYDSKDSSRDPSSFFAF